MNSIQATFLNRWFWLLLYLHCNSCFQRHKWPHKKLKTWKHTPCSWCRLFCLECQLIDDFRNGQNSPMRKCISTEPCLFCCVPFCLRSLLPCGKIINRSDTWFSEFYIRNCTAILNSQYSTSKFKVVVGVVGSNKSETNSFYQFLTIACYWLLLQYWLKLRTDE